MSLAPVIIFNYNRPDHSRLVWEALSRNELAIDTELYLYCDGPKANASDEMRQRIADLHAQAKQYATDAQKAGKFKDVHVVSAETNKGLANSIISGVSDVIAKHGRVIVLEDDLLTSPNFLKYMNTALDKYESYPAVFSIGGYNFPPQKMPIPKDYPYDAFVSLRCCSWGWATWEEKWEKIDWGMDYIDEFVKQPEQIRAFNRGGNDLTRMLLQQRDHKIDSWAIRYAFQHFYHHAVTILPRVSYVDNIGCDGTGSHSANTGNSVRNNLDIAIPNPHLPDVLYEDRRIVNAFYKNNSFIQLPIWKRVIRKIYRHFGALPPVYIEPRVYM